jgi:hypothetical protein
MEDSTAVPNSTVYDYSLIIPEPIAIDWEAKYNESVAQHNLTITAHSTLSNHKDVAMLCISDMFFDEAEIRDWCVEAIEFIERINGELPRGFNIPLRKRMWTVTTRVRGMVCADHDVEVEASTQEEANSMIEEYADDHFDPDEVMRDVNMRSADIEDIEVEVV